MRSDPKIDPTPKNLSWYRSKTSPVEGDGVNRQLLHWLSDDRTRRLLFQSINGSGGVLEFPSRDSAPHECDCNGLERPREAAVPGHRWVKLVTDRKRIEAILKDPEKYSSRAYAELGGGSFMLSLDPPSLEAHRLQAELFVRCFPRDRLELLQLSHAACQAAAVMAFRGPDFDLATFAEQAALRYCQLMMGYASRDYRLLETTMQVAYKALVHQVFGRHFVTDPTLIPEGKIAMAKLLARTSALIDAYQRNDEDDLKGTDDPARSGAPVLKSIAQFPSELNGEQRAIVALGAAIGTVGNVQAAVCIAMRALLEAPSLRDKARELALSEKPMFATRQLPAWISQLAGSLRDNPPIPYLPRVEVDDTGKMKSEYLLALGGGTAGRCPQDDDSLLWGDYPRASHSCIGQPLAWPLIVEIVRAVMALPGIEQALDPENGSVKGLEKRNGFACVGYPLTHRLDRRRTQSSLNVAMRIRAPVRDNADRLRSVIRTGAPRIEQALRDSAHVHFAWFEFIEGDSVLVLHTVYDGPFDAYLQHFALRNGDLFDLIFECVEDPPPMPVDKFPNEFVAHLLRYDRKPALGYFFSAYPDREVARILRDMHREP